MKIIPLHNATTFFYDRTASRYEKNQSPHYYALQQYYASILKNYFQEKKRALDIGCGPGLMMQMLGKNVIGIDISNNMLSFARSRNLSVKKASVLNIPYPSNSFHLIYSIHCIPHIQPVHRALQEIHRVLTPDGVTLLEFYNKFSLKYLVEYPYVTFKKKKNIFVRYYTSRQIKYLATKNNFYYVTHYSFGVLSCIHFLTRIPFLREIIISADLFLSKTPLKYFAGYIFFVLQKENHSINNQSDPYQN